MSIPLKEEDVQGLTWEVVEITPLYRRSMAVFGHDAEGEPIYVQRTEALISEDLLKGNEEARNDTDGRRWSQGHGSDKGGNVPLIHVGAIPLNKFYEQDGISDHLKQGDKDHLKWWLNRDENLMFRTRNGKL